MQKPGAAIVTALIDIILPTDWDQTLGDFHVHCALIAPEVVNCTVVFCCNS